MTCKTSVDETAHQKMLEQHDKDLQALEKTAAEIADKLASSPYIKDVIMLYLGADLLAPDIDFSTLKFVDVIETIK